MIHSGQPAKDFIDHATRHVLLRQGVLGIKVKIMRGQDPEGKAGPSKALPDSVQIIEPKEEQSVVQPMSQDYGAKVSRYQFLLVSSWSNAKHRLHRLLPHSNKQSSRGWRSSSSKEASRRVMVPADLMVEQCARILRRPFDGKTCQMLTLRLCRVRNLRSEINDELTHGSITSTHTFTMVNSCVNQV